MILNKIFSWINALFAVRTYTLRNFTAFLLVLFCIQYIPIESRAGVSFVKVGASVLSLFVLLIYSFKVTKAMMLVVVYYGFVLFAALMHPATLRWSTVLYLGSFLILYITYYNLITIEQIFSVDFFIKLLESLLTAYFITLVIQQLFLLAGIKIFPLINLVQILNRGIGANSLSYEPSSAARIMGVAFLALLRMWELKYNRILSLREIYQENKLAVMGFLWSMLTMGSGTAFVVLGILMLYFLKKEYIMALLPISLMLIVIINLIDFEPLTRALDGIEVFISMDTELAKETDTSAAVRIAPLINTFTKLDLEDFSTWFGHGVDAGSGWNYVEMIQSRVVGSIYEYGLLSFITMQIIVYTCAIKNFFSIESIIWIFLFGMSFGNIPYTWGALMVFASVRHFQEQYENGLLEIDTDDER